MDTDFVSAMGSVTVEVQADHPGQWARHRRHTYHAEPGMLTVLSCVR